MSKNMKRDACFPRLTSPGTTFCWGMASSAFVKLRFFSRRSSKKPTKVIKRKRRQLFWHTHLQLTAGCASIGVPRTRFPPPPFPLTYVVVFDFATRHYLASENGNRRSHASFKFLRWMDLSLIFLNGPWKSFFTKLNACVRLFCSFFSSFFMYKTSKEGEKIAVFRHRDRRYRAWEIYCFFFLRISFLCYNILYISYLFKLL